MIAPGSSIITYTSTTANYYYISNVNTNIIFQWTMNSQHSAPGSIKIVLPTGFTVLAEALCKLRKNTITNLVPGTCTVDTVNRAFTFVLGAGTSLDTSNVLYFEVVATNPPVAGTTGIMALSFYSDASATTLIQITSGSAITILNYSHLNSWMLEYKTQMT
jgi:hypothetical protein